MARDKNISDLPRDVESPYTPAANAASELAERTAETAVVPGVAPNASTGTRAVRIRDLSREASDRNLSVAATAVFPSEVTVALPPGSPGPSVFSAGAALPPPGMETRMAKLK